MNHTDTIAETEANLTEPLSCGHIPQVQDDWSIWWLAGTYSSETAIAGTVCFTCAVIAEESGHTVTRIPTNEQMGTWLDADMQDIGTN